MRFIFKRAKKNKKRSNSYLEIAESIGLIKRKKKQYILTDFGKENGCYITKTGSIGFAGNSIPLILSNS